MPPPNDPLDMKKHTHVLNPSQVSIHMEIKIIQEKININSKIFSINSSVFFLNVKENDVNSLHEEKQIT